ncbi:RES family NAD+ phosphorylase [Rhizobium laguerreae]|uniref:RES family NAD+ phosphorylase n=1 Tax=Rhizobium laguerreae TaxID=1076926 RepID=UPI001FE0383B|nr:RES family NAD+ phosphorylase [Rhizobium laguerreae]
MILWRISNYADLSGRGGLLAPGRWHHQGTPVVYCCDHPSTALLEILVQVDLNQIPRDFQLLKIHCPDNIEAFDIGIDPAAINQTSRTRDRGSKLLEDNDFCLLRVPSAIMPEAAKHSYQSASSRRVASDNRKNDPLSFRQPAIALRKSIVSDQERRAA